MFRKLKIACLIVGTYKIGCFALDVGLGVNTYYMKEAPNLSENYGGYALISYPDTNLAKSYGEYLAKNNINLIFLSRNGILDIHYQKKLSEINEKIDIKTIDFNIKSENKADWEALSSNLNKYDISMLINSVDIQETPRVIEDATLPSLKEIALGNILPNAVLTNQFLAKFEKRTKKSAIINIGSMFGEIPIPFNSTYSGSKAFLNYLSKGLAYETNDNVDVLLVTPGLVNNGNGFGVTSQEIVDNSFKNLEGKNWIFGSPKQAALFYLFRCCPQLTEKYFMVKGLMEIHEKR